MPQLIVDVDGGATPTRDPPRRHPDRDADDANADFHADPPTPTPTPTRPPRDADTDPHRRPRGRSVRQITFEGGLLDPTTGVDSATGVVTLDTATPIHGTASARFANTTGYLQEAFPGDADTFLTMRLRLVALPVGSPRIVFLSNAGTTVGNITLSSAGRLRLRNASTNDRGRVGRAAGRQHVPHRAAPDEGQRANGVLEAFLRRTAGRSVHRSRGSPAGRGRRRPTARGSGRPTAPRSTSRSMTCSSRAARCRHRSRRPARSCSPRRSRARRTSPTSPSDGTAGFLAVDDPRSTFFCPVGSSACIVASPAV